MSSRRSRPTGSTRNKKEMKYHFVYWGTSGEKILEVDSEVMPPEPGDWIRLAIAQDGHMIKRYIVKDVYFAPKSQTEPINYIIYIEVEPT
jgi:hypothetical protein